MAEWLYEDVYCRYLSPGECIVHDNGELNTNLQRKLARDFGVDMRCTKGGRPWANGQAEAAVKLVKKKIRLIVLENQDENKFPKEWDGLVLANALQMIRCDPCVATGFAPAELLLGRPLVYPIEFEQADVDMTGTTMTAPLVQKLKQIRENNFGIASRKIKKTQAKYKKQYDKKMKARPFKIRIGDKVQYKRHKAKRVLSKTDELTRWAPMKGYHLVLAVDFEKQRVILQDVRGNKLAKTHPFERIRKFKG